MKTTRWDDKYDIGMIPKAIAESKRVNPQGEIREQWEAAIFKDLDRPDPKFSWLNFLRGCLP